MGLLDSLTKNADLFGEAANLVKQNPDLVKAASALFSKDDISLAEAGAWKESWRRWIPAV